MSVDTFKRREDTLKYAKLRDTCISFVLKYPSDYEKTVIQKNYTNLSFL